MLSLRCSQASSWQSRTCRAAPSAAATAHRRVAVAPTSAHKRPAQVPTCKSGPEASSASPTRLTGIVGVLALSTALLLGPLDCSVASEASAAPSVVSSSKILPLPQALQDAATKDPVVASALPQVQADEPQPARRSKRDFYANWGLFNAGAACFFVALTHVSSSELAVGVAAVMAARTPSPTAASEEDATPTSEDLAKAGRGAAGVIVFVGLFQVHCSKVFDCLDAYLMSS